MTAPILRIDRLPAASDIRVRLEPLDPDRLGKAWRALEARSDGSFFQSWGWIGCWLRHLPPDRQPLAALATSGEEVVGLGVFLVRRKWRYGVVPVDCLGLHQSGEAALDSLHIEHNGLLVARRHARAVWQATLGLLTGPGCRDELALGGLERVTAELCIEAARAQRCEVVVRQRSRSAHLHLAQLRRSGRGLAPTLSRNTRHQLTRARRLYDAIGPVTLRPAQTADEAVAMLAELKDLHQRSWRRRGQPGCFATPFFETFHRDLIYDRFRYGEVQLLCAAAGRRPIGYLYNFAHRGRVYAYQSGFDYAADGRLKPGLVTHALAIEQAMREGFAIYDFMAGENRLKASFASHWTDMRWLSVRGPSAASWIARPFAGWHTRVSAAWPRRRSVPSGPAADAAPLGMKQSD